MKLNNVQLYDFLLERHFSHLHHANSVATSLTFIQNGGLLSREYLEKKALFQTRQLSDEDDKANGVWNDIFFDSRDLHGHFPRQNLYGPVLFKFNLKLLCQEDLQICITKNNPMFWNKDMSDDEKYFVDMQDIKDNWDKYQLQRKMITIKDQKAPISFENLEQIILDDPKVIIYGDTELYSESFKALNNELANHPRLQQLLITRECESRCFCRSNYLNQYSTLQLAKFFLPNAHPRFSNI
jgi:hypothetical protein